MTGIVVARYNEDIKWLDEFNNFNVHLYNKGDDNLENSTKLPNIGREAHTYLTHIVENYDNLDDVIIFTQGNPDHASNIKEFNEIESYTGFKTFVEYYGKMIDGEPISQKHSPNQFWMGFKFKSNVTPESVYNFLYGKKIPVCWVSVCAIFAVDKATILKHPKEAYVQLLNLFTRPDSTWMAYVLEYSWTLMFKPEGFTDEEVKDNII